MKKENVGKIKNISISSDDGSLEILISINDEKFKKKLLRNLSLDGKLEFHGDELVYTGDKEDA